MVEKRLMLEPEVQQIFALIDARHNFLLSGGAGSGKTYSLVRVIRQVIEEKPSSKIACITYTNAAVREIEERVNHANLMVSTIHDFLWDNIKHFQKELKHVIIELINDENITQINIDGAPLHLNFFEELGVDIQYKEFTRIREGIISHDEILLVASEMFRRYVKVNDILKDKYALILIDEYQDSSKLVVDILLTHLRQSQKENIIGFFGDAMQSIYDNSVGNLNDYADRVTEIKKTQNRRNPAKIIALANKLRSDQLQQVASGDLQAPNMTNGQLKPGVITFFYSANDDIAKTKNILINEYEWNFDNARETKELNLTHNLIAERAGFRTLMDIYAKDQVLAFRGRIKKHIRDNNIQTDFSANTFGEVVTLLQKDKTGNALRDVSPTPGMKIFIDEHPELYAAARDYNYELFSKMHVDADQLIDDKKQDEAEENKKGSKRDRLIQHLMKIEKAISLYKSRQYNEFLKATDYRFSIRSIADKQTLRDRINNLIQVGDKNIETVITEAHDSGICIIDDKLEDFKLQKQYVYDRVKAVKYTEFQKLYEYVEGKTPFSTQHKTKGTEVDNVLVILNNGGWRNYNFEYLFNNNGSASVLERTQKIFYVCCTRAKERLALFYYAPSQAVIHKAKEWFGEDSVRNITGENIN